MRRKPATPNLQSLVDAGNVRVLHEDGQTFYAVVDVIAALAETADPQQYWDDLKAREPRLRDLAHEVQFVGKDPQQLDGVRIEGLLRLVQSIPSPRAERVKRWLASTARQHLAEAENPELAVLRTRKLYEQRGYAPRWVDKRLRGISARQELTSEWFKRGAHDGEHYRRLTNQMMQTAFGRDVEGYRRFKGLFGTTENLRDHMTDLELALVALAETVAVNLHRERGSKGLEQLAADAKDAGEIVALARQQIEARGGKSIPTPANHRNWWTSRAPRGGGRSRKAVA